MMAPRPSPEPPPSGAPASAWAPLGRGVFRSLWLGALAANIAQWVQNAVGSWDMTSFGTAPIYVALLQTMSGLPVLLVGLPAAAFADLFDRRRLLRGFAAWMAVVSAALAVLSFLGLLGPVALLALTFALGLGAALSAPMWQSVLPSLVPPAELASAVTLSGVAINIARAVGPAIGGLGVALAGSGAVYTFNALAFLVVVVQVHRWRPEAPARPRLAPERVAGAMVAGLRFAAHAPALRAVIARAAAFIVCGSALWALLPVIARGELHMTPLEFGALLGCVGAGALLGAARMPGLRARFGPDRLVVGASVVYAATMATLGLVRTPPVLYAAMLATGVAWICVMSSLNVAAASAAPPWVRARALGLYLLVFQGGLAFGSLGWGALAGRLGSPTTLALAAAGLLLGATSAVRWRLGDAKQDDVKPWAAWPEPTLVGPVEDDAGPVLIVRRHRVPAAHRGEFLKLSRELEALRRRDGASEWALYEDVAADGEFVETFALASWSEHQRQHARAVVADKRLLDRLAALSGDGGVHHLVDAHALAAARARGVELHAHSHPPEPR